MRKKERLRREKLEGAADLLEDPSEVIRAYEYARECHQGQTRLDGEGFINHPVRVTESVARHMAGKNPSEAGIAVTASLLHDAVEDTAATVEDVSRLFGKEVAEVVFALSRDEEESYEDYLVRVSMSPIAMLVKRCDKLDNIQSLANSPAEFRNRKKAETLALLPLWRKIDPDEVPLIRSAIDRI